MASLEDRVTALERIQASIHARIEELSQDMTASFQQLAGYQLQIEQKIDTIRTNMASKADLANMETRILDAFKQLITTIDTRLPPQ